MRRSTPVLWLISFAVGTALAGGPLWAGQKTSGWKMPRTADGHPDLQGFWTNDTYTPLERPDEAKGKAVFTPEEAKAFLKSRLDRLIAQSRTDIHYDDALWQAENYAKQPDLRTSLVTDPPDGKLPPITEAAKAALAARQKARASVGAADSAQARTLAERCIAWGNVGPPMIPPTYNANFQVLQSNDNVVIRHEMMHDVRLVELSSRARPASAVQQLAGLARGRWEGDTLVVDTTNFTNNTNFRGSPQNTRQDIFTSATLHVVERFTLVDQDTMRYQFTVEDPSVWTKSWSGEMPIRRFEGPIYEYACHEGNYGLPNILRAARVQESAGQTADAPTPFNRFAR
jgi:hypothetical protein